MNHALNWEAISAIGQVVGAVAVVISLIYVASEVRRNTRATQLAAMRSMHDAFNRWIQQLGQYPQLAEVYYRGLHDSESLQPTDFVRFSFDFLRRCITSKRRAISKNVCGGGEKRPCKTSTRIPEFRLIVNDKMKPPQPSLWDWLVAIILGLWDCLRELIRRKHK
jgi:hypothetical protein